MRSNYHTHSRYCDGKGELREYVELALANGFAALGFSGHAPLPFQNSFSIHDEDYLAYCDEVRALKEEYRGRIDIAGSMDTLAVGESWRMTEQSFNLGTVRNVASSETSCGSKVFQVVAPGLHEPYITIKRIR